LVRIGLYCFNCTKLGQLILSRIIKTVATRCQVLRLKCTKIDFGWDSAGGAYSAPPDPLAGLRGPTSKGREKGGRGGKGRKGWGREEGEGKGGEGKENVLPHVKQAVAAYVGLVCGANVFYFAMGWVGLG